MRFFSDWDPVDFFFFLTAPICIMILLIIFGPKMCAISERDRQERLFKECVEDQSASECRFLLQEPVL